MTSTTTRAAHPHLHPHPHPHPHAGDEHNDEHDDEGDSFKTVSVTHLAKSTLALGDEA